MSNANKNELDIRFILKLGDTFLTEQDIAIQIDVLLVDQVRRKVNQQTTDGAISIRYWGVEFLGEDFWDEVNILVDSTAARLPNLLLGQIVQDYLPLNGCELRLTPQHNHVLFELVREGKLPIQRRQVLPLHLFVREFYLMNWRLAKTLATFGGGTYGSMLSRWQEKIDPALLPLVTHDDVAWVVEQPLSVVLTEAR